VAGTTAMQHTPRRHLTTATARGYQTQAMSKPRNHIRHICRTFYLSEWWDE
jgi:hypothetical protein